MGRCERVWLNRVVLAGAAWLAATAALAQTAPSPTTVAPLTVQGAAPPKVVEKQSKSFVQSFAAPTAKLDQLARWHDPICVVVAGLVPEQNAQVKARVEDVARAVGRSVRNPGCPANIQILFADQPQRLLDAIAARREEVLGYYHRHETKTLKTVTRPIQAWYVTATESGGGNGAAGLDFSVGSAGSLLQQVHRRVVDDPDNAPPPGCGDSRFSACLNSEFDNILVVVDNGRVKDRSLGLVSDYVVMLALSQPRSLDGCNVLPSVIDLFAACPDRDAPNGLTPADAAYLTALYAADLEAGKGGEQSDIAARMAKILIPAKARAGAGAKSTDTPPPDAQAR